MANQAFLDRIHRIQTGTQWKPAGVVTPSRRARRRLAFNLDRFITKLRGPLFLSTGFILGMMCMRHWPTFVDYLRSVLSDAPF